MARYGFPSFMFFIPLQHKHKESCLLQKGSRTSWVFPKAFFFFNFLIYFLYIYYFWLCWVLVAARGLPPGAVSRATLRHCAQAPHYGGLSCRGARASVVVAHRLSCSAACRIFPDQGSNPCPLHRQADSQPLHHQGSPPKAFLNYVMVQPFCFDHQFITSAKPPSSFCYLMNCQRPICHWLGVRFK